MPDIFASRRVSNLLLSFAFLLFTLSCGLLPVPAHAVRLDAALNEQVVQIPVGSGEQSAQLETTVFKPPGDGPFPLVLMNHGKSIGDPHNQGRDRFIALARQFVARGYAVVVPMRRGFAQSTGEYIDPGCDMTEHGELQANDVEAALQWLDAQSWVDRDRVIVAGQSYGGLAALAFGARNFPGVRGVINFAGGLKIHGGGCRWKQSLVQAFAAFGAHSSLPSLWFYGENDRHFGPRLAAELYDAYLQAGGHARLIAYGRFKDDAHGMTGSRDGVRVWWPETEKFLKEIGMPTEQVLALGPDFPIARTDYAPLDNVDAIPYLKNGGREQYKAFLNLPFPRAFAVSPSGAWSWAEDGDDPLDQALSDCQKHSSQPCKLYAVNDKVVWVDPQAATRVAANPAPVVPATAEAAAPAATTAEVAAAVVAQGGQPVGVRAAEPLAGEPIAAAAPVRASAQAATGVPQKTGL